MSVGLKWIFSFFLSYSYNISIENQMKTQPFLKVYKSLVRLFFGSSFTFIAESNLLTFVALNRYPRFCPNDCNWSNYFNWRTVLMCCWWSTQYFLLYSLGFFIHGLKLPFARNPTTTILLMFFGFFVYYLLFDQSN